MFCGSQSNYQGTLHSLIGVVIEFAIHSYFSLHAQMNMLQTLDRLHPYVTKQQVHSNKVLLLWLQFYEIITRYPDINTGIKHLGLLRTLVQQGQRDLTMCALEIIRNMAFNVSNRASLLTSGMSSIFTDNGTLEN